MSSLVTRNIFLNGRRTSLRIEMPVWDGLDEIARREGMSINELCTHIDCNRPERSLTASVRVYVLTYFRAMAERHFAHANVAESKPQSGRRVDPVPAQ